MSKTLQAIAAREWVQHVDDERNIDNGIIVMLKEGWEFQLDPGCGTRGFDTPTEAKAGTAKTAVRQTQPETLTEKVSKMDDAKFERWMKRNGYTGMAAVRLAAKRREALRTNP